MFANYRVPHVLCHEGILVYSDRLKERLSKEELILIDDEDEVEIRAASILPVDLLVRQANEEIPFEKDLGDEGQQLSNATVDFFLWRRRRIHEEEYRRPPFHRTRSVFC